MGKKGISLIALIIVIITMIILLAIILGVPMDSHKVTYASFMMNNEPITIEVQSRMYSRMANATIFMDTSGNSYYVTNFIVWEEQRDDK